MYNDRMNCTCAQPGDCPRFDKRMVGRLYQICQGTCVPGHENYDPAVPPLTWEKRDAYLARWSNEARVTTVGGALNLAARVTGIKRAVSRHPLLRAFRSRRKLYLQWREARRKWKAAGRPVRSEAEQTEILVRICPACPHVKMQPNSILAAGCGKCGCMLGSSAVFTGKVEMATEHCPIEKWPGEANYTSATCDSAAPLQ
jgi:hypothetical protein